MTLREALKPVSYIAELQVMKKTGFDYEYVFPKTELITREVLERFYPELIDREITDGFHGDGDRPGLYVFI